MQYLKNYLNYHPLSFYVHFQTSYLTISFLVFARLKFRQFPLFKVKKRIRLERRQFSLVNIQNTHGSCDKLNATRREGFKACLRAERSKKSTVPEGETSDKYFPQSFVSARDSLTRETSSMHRAFTVNYCASRVYLGACEEISAIIFLLRSYSAGFFSGWIF